MQLYLNIIYLTYKMFHILTVDKKNPLHINIKQYNLMYRNITHTHARLTFNNTGDSQLKIKSN